MLNNTSNSSNAFPVLIYSRTTLPVLCDQDFLKSYDESPKFMSFQLSTFLYPSFTKDLYIKQAQKKFIILNREKKIDCEKKRNSYDFFFVSYYVRKIKMI